MKDENIRRIIARKFIVFVLLLILFLVFIFSIGEKTSKDFNSNKAITVGIGTKKQPGASSSIMHYHYAVEGEKYVGSDFEGLVEMDFLLFRPFIIEYHKIKQGRSRILQPTSILMGDSVMAIKESVVHRVLRKGETVYANNMDLYEFQYLFSKRHGKTVEECLKGLNLNSYPKPAIKIPIDE